MFNHHHRSNYYYVKWWWRLDLKKILLEKNQSKNNFKKKNSIFSENLKWMSKRAEQNFANQSTDKSIVENNKKKMNGQKINK